MRLRWVSHRAMFPLACEGPQDRLPHPGGGVSVRQSPYERQFHVHDRHHPLVLVDSDANGTVGSLSHNEVSKVFIVYVWNVRLSEDRLTIGICRKGIEVVLIKIQTESDKAEHARAQLMHRCEVLHVRLPEVLHAWQAWIRPLVRTSHK